MTNRTILQRAHRVTVLTTFTALVFSLFFQINKVGPFRALNPFAEDPYDAIGSFAIQGVLLVGLLTYARSLRLQEDPAQAAKMCLILRGNHLVLLAILVTLFADAIAATLHPRALSDWGIILLVELGLMFLLAMVGVLAFMSVFWRMPKEIPPNDLTPADAIDDLWTLVRVPVTLLSIVLPRALVEWVKQFNSNRFFVHVPWFNPREHPWRFACILGLFVGICLVLVQFQEGLPPSLQIGLFVAGIFISAEFAATLAGFAMLGGYLGLRPPLYTGD